MKLASPRVPLAAAALLLAALGPPPARPAAPSEYEVKAAFLYNFALYVEWPPDGFPPSGQAFVVTVLGPDPFGEALDTILHGKTIRDRRLEVRRVGRAEDVGRSQILFIGEADSEDLGRILRRLEAAPILTVGETAHFAERGGMISFRKEKDRVGFEINLGSAERARLRISSQLLKLARIVGPGGRS
jgi:hypothetical protein